MEGSRVFLSSSRTMSWNHITQPYNLGDRHRCNLGSVYTERQRQRCDDPCNIALIEINGVAPNWVTTPVWGDCICFHWFQWELCHKHHHSVDSALMLTLGVNGSQVCVIYRLLFFHDYFDVGKLNVNLVFTIDLFSTQCLTFLKYTIEGSVMIDV